MGVFGEGDSPLGYRMSLEPLLRRRVRVSRTIPFMLMIRALSFMRPPDIENDIKCVAQNDTLFSCVIIMILIKFNLTVI